MDENPSDIKGSDDTSEASPKTLICLRIHSIEGLPATEPIVQLTISSPDDTSSSLWSHLVTPEIRSFSGYAYVGAWTSFIFNGNALKFTLRRSGKTITCTALSTVHASGKLDLLSSGLSQHDIEMAASPFESTTTTAQWKHATINLYGGAHQHSNPIAELGDLDNDIEMTSRTTATSDDNNNNNNNNKEDEQDSMQQMFTIKCLKLKVSIMCMPYTQWKTTSQHPYILGAGLLELQVTPLPPMMHSYAHGGFMGLACDIVCDDTWMDILMKQDKAAGTAARNVGKKLLAKEWPSKETAMLMPLLENSPVLCAMGLVRTGCCVRQTLEHHTTSITYETPGKGCDQDSKTNNNCGSSMKQRTTFERLPSVLEGPWKGQGVVGADTAAAREARARYPSHGGDDDDDGYDNDNSQDVDRHALLPPSPGLARTIQRKAAIERLLDYQASMSSPNPHGYLPLAMEWDVWLDPYTPSSIAAASIAHGSAFSLVKQAILNSIPLFGACARRAGMSQIEAEGTSPMKWLNAFGHSINIAVNGDEKVSLPINEDGFKRYYRLEVQLEALEGLDQKAITANMTHPVVVVGVVDSQDGMFAKTRTKPSSSVSSNKNNESLSLSSGIVWNGDDGKLSFYPLPTDLNKDDLLLEFRGGTHSGTKKRHRWASARLDLAAIAKENPELIEGQAISILCALGEPEEMMRTNCGVYVENSSGGTTGTGGGRLKMMENGNKKDDKKHITSPTTVISRGKKKLRAHIKGSRHGRTDGDYEEEEEESDDESALPPAGLKRSFTAIAKLADTQQLEEMVKEGLDNLSEKYWRLINNNNVSGSNDEDVEEKGSPSVVGGRTSHIKGGGGGEAWRGVALRLQFKLVKISPIEAAVNLGVTPAAARTGIAMLTNPGGLYLDIKSAYSRAFDLQCFVTALKGIGVHVKAVCSFQKAQLAMGSLCNTVHFFHGLNGLENACDNGLVPAGQFVLINGASFLLELKPAMVSALSDKQRHDLLAGSTSHPLDPFALRKYITLCEQGGIVGGIYVQEPDCASSAVDALCRLVDTYQRYFPLGFAYGHLSGVGLSALDLSGRGFASQQIVEELAARSKLSERAMNHIAAGDHRKVSLATTIAWAERLLRGRDWVALKEQRALLALFAEVWPQKGLLTVLEELGDIERVIHRFFDHYELLHPLTVFEAGYNLNHTKALIRLLRDKGVFAAQSKERKLQLARYFTSSAMYGYGLTFIAQKLGLRRSLHKMAKEALVCLLESSTAAEVEMVIEDLGGRKRVKTLLAGSLNLSRSYTRRLADVDMVHQSHESEGAGESDQNRSNNMQLGPCALAYHVTGLKYAAIDRRGFREELDRVGLQAYTHSRHKTKRERFLKATRKATHFLITVGFNVFCSIITLGLYAAFFVFPRLFYSQLKGRVGFGMVVAAVLGMILAVAALILIWVFIGLGEEAAARGGGGGSVPLDEGADVLDF